LISAFRNSDAVIIGGGGIFQDIYNFYPIPFFTSMAVLARLFGKQLLLHSVGIGPICSFISRKLCRIAANSAHSISVRDAESKELLQEIGVNREIQVSADPVFLLKSMCLDKIEMHMDMQKTDKDVPTVGVCVQNLLFWSQENKKALARTLDILISQKNVRIVFLPFGVYQDNWFHREMSEPVDIAASKELAGMLKSRHTVFTSYTTPEEIMAVIGGLDLMISMRLHGIIMGISMGVPVIALTYVNESKIRNLMKRIGHDEDVFYVNDLDTEKILSRIENIVSRNNEFKQDIREKAVYLKREAEKSIELLSERLSLLSH
jgi:polysaccharide pyruvyl transferase CsaB